ncbi:MAB_1171c family putative transporter [Streptomyces hygroscopicus]|uniref:MAB_1171c family putative transporter n=1 Tax=Streptomyces hygroscopicus TaxID=1912 RepID=UPI001FCAD278|nr:MAB_1171c family putative transporter [Streptomyces hygroscopicus]BDH10508.1 hypothetical protein HOK021_16870 [Streptomyces hygroscopicus]
MLHNTVYGVLSIITWTAFCYKAKDLIKDPRNPELRLLCLAIATFATPFVIAAPWLYVRLDRLLGYPNFMTLVVYVCVATCLTAFVALLVSWSSAQSAARLRHRLLVAYSVVSIVVMIVLFLLGDVSDAEHAVDFDAHYASTPYIAEFLFTYALLFAVSMSGLVRLCWEYAKAVDKPWLRRGLRVVAVGAVFGFCYAAPKIISLFWETPFTNFINSYIAPMSASVSAAFFAIGFTMPAWGVGLDRFREFRSNYRAYQRLYPLWSAMIGAFPQVALFPLSPRGGGWTVRTVHRLFRRQVVEAPAGLLSRRLHQDLEVEQTGRDLKLLVSRQVIEIRDGQLLLRPHYDPEIAELARELATKRHLAGDALEAVIEASQIASALQALATGCTPAAAHSVLPHDPADGDIKEEGLWLTRVADAYRRSPIVQLVLAADREKPKGQVATK